jgi:transmembrane protein EpsG
VSVYLSVIALIGFLWFIHASAPALAGSPLFGGESQAADHRRVPLWLAIPAAAILIAVAMFRWRVGVDYDTYAQSYPMLRDAEWVDLGAFGEPGIRWIAKVAAVIHDDYATMFALAALITLALCTRTLHRYSDAFFLSLVLFVLMGAWQGTFNGMRQWLACAVVFASHRFILERRFLPYLFVVLVGALFHLSALVLLLIYFVPRRRLGLGRGTMLVLGAVVATQSYDLLAQGVELLRSDIDELTRSGYFNEQVNPLRVLSALGPVFLYLAFTDRDRLSERGQFYVNLAFVHAAITVAAFNSAYIMRFTIYTVPFVALAIPAMLNMQNRTWRGLLIAVTTALYSVVWYLDTTYSTYTATFRWVFER